MLSTKKPESMSDAKKRPVSGVVQNKLSKLEKIYGNLPELVVPLEEEPDLSPSESTFSIKTGFTRRSGQGQKGKSKKMKGIQAIYNAKLYKRP